MVGGVGGGGWRGLWKGGKEGWAAPPLQNMDDDKHVLSNVFDISKLKNHEERS